MCTGAFSISPIGSPSSALLLSRGILPGFKPHIDGNYGDAGSSFGLTVLPLSKMAKLKAFQRSRESTQSPIFLGRFCSENWFQSWADLERAEEHDCALPIPDGLSVPRGGILSGGAVRCILRRGPGLWSDRGISRGSTQARVGQ